MRHVAVFLAVALADVLWTRWMLATSRGQALRAGAASAAIILVGGFTTLAYVGDPIYLLPAALGAFVGTFISVSVYG